MKFCDSLAFFFIALAYNVTFIGKLWLTFLILPRFMIIIFAGYPLYQDEHEHFICKSREPGCANTCYDLVFPISHLQFWLIQTVFILLPYAVFSVYVWHNVVRQVVKAHSSSYYSYKEIKAATGHQMTKKSSKNAARSTSICEANGMDIPNFSRAYIVHLLLKLLMEIGFLVGHSCLFGFFAPRHVFCEQFPCPNRVECHVSRPTEKSVMMVFMWGLSVLSILFCLVDLFFAFRTSILRNRKNELLLEMREADEKRTLDQHHSDSQTQLHEHHQHCQL